MNQVLSSEEVMQLVGTQADRGDAERLVRAIEAAVLAKFGEPVGYYEPKEKRFIYDTTHPKYYLRLYALEEDTECNHAKQYHSSCYVPHHQSYCGGRSLKGYGNDHPR